MYKKTRLSPFFAELARPVHRDLSEDIKRFLIEDEPTQAYKNGETFYSTAMMIADLSCQQDEQKENHS